MATTRKWSKNVTETSDAMDVASGTFKQTDPKKLAAAVEHDAESSTRRKASPYRSAMSMLTFYINRAGSNLSAKQRKVLEQAKDVLREQYGPGAQSGKQKKSASSKFKGKKAAAPRSAGARTRKKAKSS